MGTELGGIEYFWGVSKFVKELEEVNAWIEGTK